MRESKSDVPPLDEVAASKKLCAGKVVLNVGGKLFTTSWDTLSTHGNSYFKMFRDQHFQIEAETFIDRNPKHFEAILDYLRCRAFTAHIGASLQTLAELQRELLYYQLSELEMLIQNEAKGLISAKIGECRTLRDLLKYEKVVTSFGFLSEAVREIITSKKEELKNVVNFDIDGKIFHLQKKVFKELDDEFGFDSKIDLHKIPPDNYFQFQRDPELFSIILKFLETYSTNSVSATALIHFSEFKLMKIIDELHFYDIAFISNYFEAALRYVRAPLAIQISGHGGCCDGVYNKSPVPDVDHDTILSYEKEGMRLVWETYILRWEIHDGLRNVYARSGKLYKNFDSSLEYLWQRLKWETFGSQDDWEVKKEMHAHSTRPNR